MRHLLLSVLILAGSGLTAGDAAPAPAPVPAPAPAQAPAAKPPALTLADLPEAVRTVMLKQADGATVERIKAEERGGEKTYGARWTKEQVRHEIRLGADGRVLKLKAERKGKDGKLTLESLPEAVRAAITARLDGGTVVEIEQEDEKGKTVYGVEIQRAADRLELELEADGTVTEEEVKPLEGKKPKASEEKKAKPEMEDKDGKGAHGDQPAPAPVPAP